MGETSYLDDWYADARREGWVEQFTYYDPDAHTNTDAIEGAVMLTIVNTMGDGAETHIFFDVTWDEWETFFLKWQ